MKKDFLKTMLFMLCALCAFSFTACSDDDPADAASQVAGAYSGTLEAFLNGASVAETQKTITLAKNTATSVDIVINNFTIDVTLAGLTSTVNLGNVTISNCALTETANGYTFAGNVRIPNVKVPIGTMEMTTDYCDVTFTNATINGNTLTLPLSVGVTLNGNLLENLAITVDFTGTK